jgi:hypothetical protein
MCRLAEEAAVTAGVPQKAADFAAMPHSAGAGQGTDACIHAASNAGLANTTEVSICRSGMRQ